MLSDPDLIACCCCSYLYIFVWEKFHVCIGNGSEDSIDVTNEEPLTPQRSGCAQLPPVLPSIYSPASAETVYETSARLLFMAVKWAKNLPSFASLPFRDQVIYLKISGNGQSRQGLIKQRNNIIVTINLLLYFILRYIHFLKH